MDVECIMSGDVVFFFYVECVCISFLHGTCCNIKLLVLSEYV